jgi:hypothetical protein
MKAGTVLFNGADLALYGAPRFTLRKTPEPAAPAKATHRRVEVVVGVSLRAEMPATVWARARALQALLASTSEGLLEIRDENGTVVSWMATPGETNLPQAIERRQGAVEMSFTAIEPVAEQGYPLGMTLDPLDGGLSIAIARPLSWSETVAVSRPDSRSAGRSEIGSTIAFSARTAYADPLLAVADRVESLMAEAERLNALSGKQVRLVFAGFDRVVQVENFRATPNDGWEWIDLEAQARYVTLPGDTEAEVQFSSETTEDPSTGEIRTVVNGTVRAAEKTLAEQKIEAITEAWRTSARRVSRIVKRDSWLDGEDFTTPEWTGMDFTIEFTEGSEEARYSLTITTADSADGRRVTYSGSAYAATVDALLVAVEQAAGNKHTVTVREEVAIDMATDDTGAEKLMQARFTHEYAVQAVMLTGTVTRTSTRGRLGEQLSSVSGSVSVTTDFNARTLARSFIPLGVILRTDEETENIAMNGQALQVTTLNFSYAWGVTHGSTSIQYEDTESPDYSRMITVREISGTCWAPSKDAAVNAVAALKASIASGTPLRESYSHSLERETVGNNPATERWTALRFTVAYETTLTGSIGHDIIEASFSLQRIGQVDHYPITEIPLGMPVTQSYGGAGFGHNMGRLVASGTVKARVQATARQWGQSKRSSAATTNGHIGRADPPDERMTVSYVPLNGVNAASYQFDFQYSFRYADGLRDTWPSSGLTV